MQPSESSAANVDEQLDLFATAKAVPANKAPTKPPCAQLTELPGVDFEDIFACRIDESAGLAEDAA